MSDAAARWPCLRAGAGGSGHCTLQVAVVPNAKRTLTDGLFDGALRIRLAAPPVEGRANEALRAWLAAELALPRRSVQLLRGESARRKVLAIAAAPGTVLAWLDGQAAQPGHPSRPSHAIGGPGEDAAL